MTAWLFPRLDAVVGGAGAYDPSSPFRLVIHTTETMADPRNWVPGWQYPSHVVADPKRRVVVQCVPLDEAAKALYNAAGGVETNRARAIQVEINVSSPRTPDTDPLTEDDYRWLGKTVLAPIVAWCAAQRSPIDLGMIPAVGPIDGSASAAAPQRFSFAAWTQFDGICGHRHVPENDHWDAGCINLHKLASYAAGDLGGATTPEKDDMTPAQEQQLARCADVAEQVASGQLTGAIVRELDPRFNALAVRLDAVEASQIPTAGEIAAELLRQMGARR